MKIIKNHEFNLNIKNIDKIHIDTYYFLCTKCKYKIYIVKNDIFDKIYYIDIYWSSNLKKMISCEEQLIKILLE